MSDPLRAHTPMPWLVAALIAGGACSSPPERRAPEAPPGPAPATTGSSASTSPAASRRALPWSIEYRDGNANRYRFWQDGSVARYLYDPVRPEHSSTGHYSGGEPAQGNLTEEQVDALWRVIDRLVNDPTLHVAHRSKGTGQLSLATPEGDRSVIVRMGEEVRGLDAHLEVYRGRAAPD